MTTRALSVLALVAACALEIGFASGARAQDSGITVETGGADLNSAGTLAAGTVTLGGANTFTGVTTISNGTLSLATTNTQAWANGTLIVNSGANTYSGTTTISSGTISVATGSPTAGAAILVVNASTALNGTTALIGDTLTINSGATLTLNAATYAAGNYIVGSSGQLTLNLGGLMGTGSSFLPLSVTSPDLNDGVLPLAGASTYSGAMAGSLVGEMGDFSNVVTQAAQAPSFSAQAQPAAVPEPTSYLMALVAVVALFVLRRRAVLAKR